MIPSLLRRYHRPGTSWFPLFPTVTAKRPPMNTCGMMGGFFPPSRKLVHGGPTNRVQRWPNTNRPLVNIGIVFRTRVRLCVLPMTTRGVPMWTRSKNRAARSRGIRTHPWDAGIAWKVTSVHTNRRAEFHVVRHRRGSKWPPPGYMATGSCIRVDDSSGSIDDRSEASRMMVDILAENNEAARGCLPTRFT